MEEAIKKYKKWKNNKEINKLNLLSENEIKNCFFKYLEFGTGGMRGIMGLGTNRMNIYMIRKAS